MFTTTLVSSNVPSLMLAIGLPSGGEWIILLILGLLIFGRRLPEVGRSLGRGIIEFKKGIKGIDDDIEEESSRPSPRATDSSARHELPKSNPQSTDDRAQYATAQQPREQ
jgi:sec-independent protein translocase protein TatA